MSFNSNNYNTIITLENYEEYFLLLVDNELTKEENLAVGAFIAAHPHLQAEMDLLLSLRLPADEGGFLNKEMLLAESMRVNLIDESLLLYIDNELNKEDSKWLEDKISKDVKLRVQHQQLLKTKLDAATHILYPFKKELYRYEDRRRMPLYWLRIAAVAIMATGIGGLVYTTQQSSLTTVAIAEPAPDKEIRPGAMVTKMPDETKKPKKDIRLFGKYDANNATRSLAKQKLPKPFAKKNIEVAHKKNNNITPVPSEEAPFENSLTSTPQQPLPKQTLNNPTVTNESVASYNDEKASSTPAVIRDAIAKTGNEKKSSLKGLLRKATRFIERRTSISATNENDELLIGAVALKL